MQQCRHLLEIISCLRCCDINVTIFVFKCSVYRLFMMHTHQMAYQKNGRSYCYSNKFAFRTFQ